MSLKNNYTEVLATIPNGVQLCAVSKFHPSEMISELYDLGHRVFGESRPQELSQKAKSLPSDIEWHFIGHLQTNKTAQVVEVASVIESVDSHRLLSAISKEALKQNKTVKVLLQMFVADEQTKQGFSGEEIEEILSSELPQNIEVIGLMAMATYTDDQNQITQEFQKVKDLFDKYPTLKTLSMGMSGDYELAIKCGSTNVRIGSAIFGNRIY